MTGCYNCEHFYQHACSSHPMCMRFVASIIDPWTYCAEFTGNNKVKPPQIHIR